ncbi:MAG: hypothetical protein PHT80_01300 [Lentisphaeria bacterium]|nr:hypothetical protein [Lentisphaeria bacterium]
MNKYAPSPGPPTPNLAARHRWRIAVACAIVAFLPTLAMTADIVFDFEDGTLQGWRVMTGTFGKIISDRPVEHNSGKPYTKDGKWYLSTLETPNGQAPNDRYTGVIDSPVIRLSTPDISMKVGGGRGPNVAVTIHDLDGNELARVTGDNQERMILRKIAIPDAVAKLIFFRVSDHSEGSWGHITLDSVSCQGEIDAEASAAHAELWARNSRREQNTRRLAALARGVAAIGARFPERYPLAELQGALTALSPEMPEEDIERFARRALVEHNPVLAELEILYVTRPQYRRDHHNTATMFQRGEINAGSYNSEGELKVLTLRTGESHSLLAPGPGATIRDPDLNFDASAVVLAMRKGRDDDYHLYRLNIATRQLTQLTSATGVTDIDPLWLPDGGIAFTSTRQPKYCMCNRHIMGNLFRMNADGSNIHQIGISTLHEGHGSLLPDGRILYDRWEYIDRNFGDAQGLWVCNPDGTAHAIFWGNNTTSPGGVIDARSLSQPSRVIATLTACHDRPWGALAIIDRNLGIDGREPVGKTWPDEFRDKIRTSGQDFDSTVKLPVKYEDPYPLDDENFLCSRQTGSGELMGIYYLDLLGNEVLLHVEEPGCYDPTPLRPRLRPPVIPVRRNYSQPHDQGFFYIQNASIGTHMAGVKPGSIKALRVVESPEKRSWTRGSWAGQGEQAPAMNWHNFENKRILGTVPVEADGSAFFAVPANTFVFFQALDENGMMIQSMRSGTYVQPGETYGCVGCHENRLSSMPPGPVQLMATSRPPNELTGWLGPPRAFSYQREVQPLFDAKCVSCHDYGKKAGEKLNLAGDRDSFFCTSYADLWALKLIHCIGGGPAEIQQAYSWGSHASRLVTVLQQGHQGLSLAPEEWNRLVTWIDLNAPYYPLYESAYPNNPGGRSPLTNAETARLAELCGGTIEKSHWKRQRAQISFDRPECSRILNNPRLAEHPDDRAEALAIIRTGAERLQQLPRADMDGFRFIPIEESRDRRYQSSRAQELRVYEAIREDRKIFDHGE